MEFSFFYLAAFDIVDESAEVKQRASFQRPEADISAQSNIVIVRNAIYATYPLRSLIASNYGGEPNKSSESAALLCEAELRSKYLWIIFIMFSPCNKKKKQLKLMELNISN